VGGPRLREIVLKELAPQIGHQEPGPLSVNNCDIIGCGMERSLAKGAGIPWVSRRASK
jgi:hypothetical protein